VTAAHRSIIVVSTFRLVREAVRALIERDQAFHVIAEAEDRTETLRVVSDLRPDLILFDLDPDYAATIETIRLLIRDRPDSRIIALSAHGEDVIIESALRAGVRGFLSKTGPSYEITAVLHVVAQGEAYLSPRIAARVMDWVKNREVTGPPIPVLAALTEREAEVLRLLAAGRTSKEIAATLNLAIETIRSYRKTLMKKLGVHNVAELLQFAASAGLITIGTPKEGE
jgi:DNA-binding NarL/FixJ family response regulator